MVSWYVASLAIPVVVEDFDTVFVLWYFTFILVGIAIVSDMVYRITDITPAYWYDIPSTFYSFLRTWVIFVVPGCVLFLVMVFSRRIFWKSEAKT